MPYSCPCEITIQAPRKSGIFQKYQRTVSRSTPPRTAVRRHARGSVRSTHKTLSSAAPEGSARVPGSTLAEQHAAVSLIGCRSASTIHLVMAGTLPLPNLLAARKRHFEVHRDTRASSILPRTPIAPLRARAQNSRYHTRRRDMIGDGALGCSR